MITKEEALKVLKNKETKNKNKTKEIVSKTIERISNDILKRGRFFVPNVSGDPEVQEQVRKAFKKEGFTIEFYITQTVNKHKKSNKIPVAYPVTNLRISISE